MTELRDEALELEAYKWGRDWAAFGMPLYHWLVPWLGKAAVDAAQRGWDDYHTKATGQ